MKKLLIALPLLFAFFLVTPQPAEAGIIRWVGKGVKVVAVNTAKGAVAVSKVSPYDIGKAIYKGGKFVVVPVAKTVGKVVY